MSAAVLAGSASALAGCSTGGGKDLKLDAFTSCQKFLTPYLKAPTTAKFRDYYGSQAPEVTQAGNLFTVASSVDSENGFGAEIRGNFDCTVTHTSGTDWHLNALSMEDAVTGEMETLVSSDLPAGQSEAAAAPASIPPPTTTTTIACPTGAVTASLASYSDGNDGTSGLAAPASATVKLTNASNARAQVTIWGVELDEAQSTIDVETNYHPHTTLQWGYGPDAEPVPPIVLNPGQSVTSTYTDSFPPAMTQQVVSTRVMTMYQFPDASPSCPGGAGDGSITWPAGYTPSSI